MPIFISYSHEDKDFVDRLAQQLVRNRVYVWLDRWELLVGDSITSRIEHAITNASALLVVLSKSSVESPWCKREINSGLLRELEERRVVVLPVLAEDCAIPLFLRDKMYADFRSSFDDGLRTILEATARISNPSTGEIEGPIYDSDWAIEWGALPDSGHMLFRITIVQHAVEQQYTVLSVVQIIADSVGDENYHRLADASDTERANAEVINQAVSVLTETQDLRIILTDQFEKAISYTAVTAIGSFEVVVTARRLGLDNGHDVLVDIGGQLQELAQQMAAVLEKPASNE
jgi:hypothetical protein